MDTTKLIAAMLKGYLECALWAGSDIPLDDAGREGGTGTPEPLDGQGFDVEDIAPEAIDEIRGDIEDFARDPGLAADWSEYARRMERHLATNGRPWTTSEQAGHDFY